MDVSEVLALGDLISDIWRVKEVEAFDIPHEEVFVLDNYSWDVPWNSLIIWVVEVVNVGNFIDRCIGIIGMNLDPVIRSTLSFCPVRENKVNKNLVIEVVHINFIFVDVVQKVKIEDCFWIDQNYKVYEKAPASKKIVLTLFENVINEN